jgi:Tfp pilus assembly protein PilF
MEGRWKQLVFCGVLCATTGCSLLRDKKPVGPSGTGEPPVAAAEEKRPVGPDLLVQMADLRLQAAMDPGKSVSDREALCNDARINYQKAMEKDPKHLGAMLGMARFSAVVKDRDSCKEWYARATSIHPNNAKIPYEQGKVLGAHFKDRDGAIASLHQATKLDPDNRLYRKDLGFTLAWAGRYDEGYQWLSRVMSEAEARYNVAAMMHFNGQDNQARQQLVLALKVDPKFEPSKMALASLNGHQPPPQQSEPQVQTVGYDDYPVPPPPSAPAATIQAPDRQY